jgi:hypothetical protein
VRTAWLLAGIAAGASACEIVDPGPDVGVASRCVVSASYYLEFIVPESEYLEAHDCARAGGCHAASGGGSIFRLEDTSGTLAPLPEDPLGAWPAAWQTTFQATTFFISDCDNAELSPLYSKPAGGATLSHEGGSLFSPGGAELDLIEAWLSGA